VRTGHRDTFPKREPGGDQGDQPDDTENDPDDEQTHNRLLGMEYRVERLLHYYGTLGREWQTDYAAG
jgi:hypothetical protein